ncbi:cupin domain-containing protein [Corallococcus llansteffanensis]|uniref:Cupin domain-containing protein n=1 Tax=Corallococcus llansteffanensis TaxID=2316731 RepID=A0A3A8QHV4_9BACT|nr:cupin domain-containing protein [Corallococcus llansteffanensis]RKH68293.1 cupin domain-containing protein [Corallococcus llansteffanensis]
MDARDLQKNELVKLTIHASLDVLSKHSQPFIPLFTHGTLEVEIYKPSGMDFQQPHAKDEVYIIATGTGHFLHEGERTSVQVGDMLFVRAGARHRFVDFSEDFSTWVVFYGPPGGEQATPVR